MKKLLKTFAILTVFACGLFTGCNNDAEEIDLNVNVTVSTDTPSLDEPKNLGYGVLLTWRATQDSNIFRVTRQAKGGEEKILRNEVYGNRCLDSVGFNNVLEEGVEYTYRVYNLGGEEYYTDNGVVKFSYTEKKITLAAGSLKKQGEKLDAVKEADVKTSFKNGHLKINFLNDENFVWGRDFVVRDVETGRKVSVSFNHEEGKYYSYNKIDAEKVNVEIKNVSYDGYYEDSDVVTIENIENIFEKGVSVSNLTATVRDKTVVLLWTTEEKVEASEFTIQRTNTSSNSSKPEVLKITPTYEEKYDGTYYWKAVDESVVDGMYYKYEVITDYNTSAAPDYVGVPGNIKITAGRYSTVDNAVTLTWEATDGISDFKIYRADGNFSNVIHGGIGDEYYDLYKPLNITFEKVDSTLDDDKKEIRTVYTAKDTTVEKDKDYTYRIVSADGLDCSWNYAVRTSQAPVILLESINLKVSVNGYSYRGIYDNEDDILLSFDNGDKNVTYKIYYTTFDNKSNESASSDYFTFTKDNDGHHRKTFKASDIKGLDKAVSVKFYVRPYDGDKWLSEVYEDEYYDSYEGRWKSEYKTRYCEWSKNVTVDPSLTTYTTFDIDINYDYSDSKYDYNNNYYYEVYHVSSKQIAIEAYGYNLDTKAITVTYFKNDGEVKTPTLTWAKVTGYDNRYTATLKVDETGDYTICATIPKDNAYNQNSYSWSKTTYVTVDE